MTSIRVDLQVLRRVVRQYAEAAQQALSASHRVASAVESATGYDGELPAQVSGIAGGIAHDLHGFSEHIADLSGTIERIADGFEAADSAALAGQLGLAASLRATVDAGYDVSALPGWMVSRDRPPWINPNVWKVMAQKDRADYWRWIDGAWGRFIGGDLTFSNGTGADLRNAFNVHMFLEGITSELPAYALWQSAARATGSSLEAYVMHVLHITTYERDTVAGIGLIETRQVGPLASLLAGQAYYNRLFSEHWGDPETAKSTFAGGSLDGVYYGHDWDDYTQAAIQKTGQNIFVYTWEQLQMTGQAEADLDRIASLGQAAAASQDGAWRMIAGYRLAEEHGIEGVSFFLQDEQSVWWQYDQDLIDEGFVDYRPLDHVADAYKAQLMDLYRDQYPDEQLLKAFVTSLVETNYVVPEYPNPSNLDVALRLIEKSYEYGNVYEMNPSFENMSKLEGYYVDPQGNPSTQVHIYPRQVKWALMDAQRDQLAYDSQVILVNRNTGVAFTTFNVTDATVFFPSY